MSIVPYKEPKKILIKRAKSGIEEVDANKHAIFLQSSKTVMDLYKENAQLRKENHESEQELKKYKLMYDSVTSGRKNKSEQAKITHEKFRESQYKLYCDRFMKDMQLIECINRRKDNRCPKACGNANRLMHIVK